MEQFGIGDIVTVAHDVEFCKFGETQSYTLKVGENCRVVMPFTGLGGTEACLVKIGNFTEPILCSELVLIEKAPEPEPEPVRPEPIEVLRNFVAEIPSYSLGYVYNIDSKLVAAHSLEEAISIYYKNMPETKIIKKIQLIDENQAYIQNEIPTI